MSILIFGASGFIGSSLYKKLSQNYHVIGTSGQNIDGLLRFNIVQDEIEKLLEIIELKDKKIAIITTAISNIDQCFKEKELAYDINVTKMEKLIKTLNHNGFKVIFLSTDFVFDGKKGNYTEESLQNPITEYGKQKAIIEKRIFNYNPNNVVVRLSKTVSNKNEPKNIFFEWLELVNKGVNITCIKGQKFVPTDVEDVADAIERIITNDLNGIYNIVSNIGYTRSDLAKLFLEIGNITTIKVLEKELAEFPFADTRSLDTTLQNHKIKRDTNMNFISMEQLIEQFWSGKK